LKSFSDFIKESTESEHNHINDNGYFHDNPGGSRMVDKNTRKYRYTRSQNINGDDHRYAIDTDHMYPSRGFKAHHMVSRQYWGNRWENPEVHKIQSTKEFSTAKEATDHLNDLIKKHRSLKRRNS